ncbi:hypothetical protein NC652_015834 [Populus alba x Populus x berolinensis]|uniref:Uncharacterized protein n=1 Tax=Populus alba x Populus x berolinensis TaxID=444605 RepID=A0AAD6VYY2_9ROSI|nr:hypothetical protein NC652_015834 [Populus alba x Populus x berolinensis]KAJ6992521.1 hypothetical protein NC653_015801 [Populus alba x Populus x berolinensis]
MKNFICDHPLCFSEMEVGPTHMARLTRKAELLDILGILPYALALKWETTPIFCLFDDINR